MKTKKIKYDPEYNFELLGVSSADDDYKLSWHLSKLLNAEFVWLANLEIRDDRFSELQIFNVFECVTLPQTSNIKLIGNRANVGFLIEELKNIDYFILIFDCDNQTTIDSLISQIKTIESITGIFRLKPENLKSREKLLF